MGNRALRNVLRSTVLTAFYLFCPKTTHAAEDYSAWPYKTDVVLNTSATGANVASTVNNFPVLVRLTSSNFPFSQALGKGLDIRFSKADGSPLAYEIERWDSTRALAEIWVKVDVIAGNTAGQIVKMLWGNPSAPDSSNAGAVFRAADNFVAAWHLNGSGTASRPNAVSGGNAAVPVAYDGDENRTGMIAGADSLDGAAAGDYLDVGDGYSEFTAGFTYSVWVYPTAMKRYSHVLDLGNGIGSDNIIVNRVDTSNDLGFHNWNGTTAYAKQVANQWALNQWQYITVTMTGRNVRMYKNGAQILADTMPGAITGVARTTNFLGKSNWTLDEYFQGKIDEPELSKTARSADWIKLAYQNQRSAQTLATVLKPTLCAAKIALPADTTIAEGETLTLEATVECATDFSWSVVSGPAPRILDPETKSLVVRIPRVQADTAMVYRLTANYADSARVRDVRVTIREAIPDPAFTMPAPGTWSGKDSLAYRPVISNLAAIKASRDSVLHWAWSFTGPAVETGSLPDGVMLMGAESDGKLQIRLCLDNGSLPVCKSADLNVSAATATLDSRADGETGRLRHGQGPVDRGRDAMGRASTPVDPRFRNWIPRFREK